jgi:hypothetical protein
LLKIKLDDEGMINLNEFIACIQSSSADLQVTNFKAFLKNIKKHEEQKKKLDAAQEKAREVHRQRQMATISSSPEGGGRKHLFRRTASGAVSRSNSTVVN